jgi:flavorubredoxin
MKAIVVYESHWGNTAAIARAIAEGIGSEAVALNTSDAVGAALAEVDLIVAGAPVLGFSLPTEDMVKNLSKESVAPDLSHPSMRSWLTALPEGKGRAAAFETRIWWSPGGSTKAILRQLEKVGYPALVEAERFLVKDRYGPLKEGELERAKQWGEKLAQAMGA